MVVVVVCWLFVGCCVVVWLYGCMVVWLCGDGGGGRRGGCGADVVVVDLPSRFFIQHRQFCDTVTCLPAHTEQGFAKVC